MVTPHEVAAAESSWLRQQAQAIVIKAIHTALKTAIEGATCLAFYSRYILYENADDDYRINSAQTRRHKSYISRIVAFFRRRQVIMLIGQQ